VDPKDIPASVLKRLPVRFNYNDTYHHSMYGGIPVNGYSYIINKMLSNKKIKIHLNQKYLASNSDFNTFDLKTENSNIYTNYT
jgi:UDP-galactopyranose mutase